MRRDELLLLVSRSHRADSSCCERERALVLPKFSCLLNDDAVSMSEYLKVTTVQVVQTVDLEELGKTLKWLVERVQELPQPGGEVGARYTA